jgi:hypothetical protein
MSEFQLFTEDFIEDRKSQYMSLKKGENKIRLLSRPIQGWEQWNKEKKVFRYRDQPSEIMDEQKPAYKFASFIVWNYSESKIQILNIKQSGILKAIGVLSSDPNWGAPFFYDLRITREGEGMTTKYNVIPIPPKELSNEIVQAFIDKPIYLDALYENKDPFASSNQKFTHGIFKKEQLKVVSMEEVQHGAAI